MPTRHEFIASGVADWSLRKFKFSQVLDGAGLESVKYKKTTPDNPKIFLFDIETAPILAYLWGLYDQNVGLNQIESDWHLLSWSGKWLGEEEVFYHDQRDAKNLEDDREILGKLWEKLNEADIVIGHNSKKFDTKKVNSRLIFHGFKPPSSFREIDTLSIARKRFSFTSNKLSHLASFLGCEDEKSEHKKFTGFELWSQCMKGNREAFGEMESYNKQDVKVLEQVYLKLRPWDYTVNFSIFDQDNVCSCGSKSFNRSGFKFTNTGKFQRFVCENCGRDMIAKENLIDSGIRKELLK